MNTVSKIGIKGSQMQSIKIGKRKIKVGDTVTFISADNKNWRTGPCVIEAILLQVPPAECCFRLAHETMRESTFVARFSQLEFIDG